MGVKTGMNGTRYDGQELDEFQGIGIYRREGNDISGRVGKRYATWVRRQWIYEEASDGRHDHQQVGPRRVFERYSRQCCDVPDPELTSPEARSEAKKKAFEAGVARALVRSGREPYWPCLCTVARTRGKDHADNRREETA